MEKKEQLLIEMAKMARNNAYVPASGFKVGAAVLAVDGTVYKGCNIENAAYSETICAERTAIFSAIASGARKLVALAIYTDTNSLTPPCGACRQVIAEFGIEKIIISNRNGEIKQYTVEELLPHSFAAINIE